MKLYPRPLSVTDSTTPSSALVTGVPWRAGISIASCSMPKNCLYSGSRKIAEIPYVGSMGHDIVMTGFSSLSVAPASPRRFASHISLNVCTILSSALRFPSISSTILRNPARNCSLRSSLRSGPISFRSSSSRNN